jgi:hypothetical protein
VKRAFIALGLSTLLLATISTPTPTVETPRMAFSFRSDAGGYGPAPIDRPMLTVEERLTGADVAVLDEWTDLVLQSGSLTVLHREEKAWTSDPSWDVQHLAVADLDHDGQQEAALALWRPFTREPTVVYDLFGHPSPWAEGSLRNHLFLYGWRDGAWRPLWCSSPLAEPIWEMAAGDTNGDGTNELAVLEGDYCSAVEEPARHLAVWRWNGWGFSLQWRSPPGAFRSLSLQDVTGDEALEIVVTSQP